MITFFFLYRYSRPVSNIDVYKRQAFDRAELDFVVLENIGNLVCPAEFDTGANFNLTILSVPEGDDKPAKYPLMYEVSDVLVINKIDALPVFDFRKDYVDCLLYTSFPPLYKVSGTKKLRRTAGH